MSLKFNIIKKYINKNINVLFLEMFEFLYLYDSKYGARTDNFYTLVK